MITIDPPSLTPGAAAKLKSYQAYVDSANSYSEQVDRAKAQFKSANRTSSEAFNDVRLKLTLACSGASRCMYCEDSYADEVEHHHPKTLYPELCFSWENYLYSCGPCNGPKNSKFAVIAEQELIIITREKNEPVVPPHVGESALLHPRTENPLAFLFLDIIGDTFRFTPHPTANALDQRRASYTIGLLSLNSRDYLPRARREAYHSYLSRLRQYHLTKRNPNLTPSLAFQEEAIKRMQHPTVLREMIRQAAFLPQVRPILADLPEVLTW